MSDSKDLIARIEANERAIEAAEKAAAPHQKKQRECSAAAKVARKAARECQAKADPYLIEAQDCRAENQQLKLEAGRIALDEKRNSVH